MDCTRGPRPLFQSAFMEITDYTEAVLGNPDLPPRVLDPVDHIFSHALFSDHRICRIFYTKAAETLACAAAFPTPLGKRAMTLLLKHMEAGHPIVRQRVSGGACRLPMTFTPPEIPSPDLTPLPQTDTMAEKDAIWYGRSRVVATDSDRILVTKYLKRGSDPLLLATESLWQHELQNHSGTCGHIPIPEGTPHRPLLQLGLPSDATDPDLDPLGIAIRFSTTCDYFCYAVEKTTEKPDTATFFSVITGAATHLGCLAAKGILHTAVIPLFHNRAQQHRREDGGRYLWQRGGRLDRWLASSLYPNIGRSGLRDFEHMDVVKKNGSPLRQEIGNQLLSLVLITAAHYRMKAPDLFGHHPDGSPMDTRHLFDRNELTRLLQKLVTAYGIGFAGTDPDWPDRPEADHLAGRIIEEAGVDTHMIEILRVRDQEAMDQAAFSAFLSKRGLPSDTPKNKEDITIATGPHLGGFNDRISIPELIGYLETASAKILAARFQITEGGKA